MSTALQTQNQNQLLSTEFNFTESQLDLIKKTVAKGATNDELKLFLYRAKQLDLDPFKPGRIYCVKYRDNPATIIVGIDGFREKAAKTGLHVGTKRGVLKDEKGKLIGGWCEVYRKDWKEPVREEISLAEYNLGRANWLTMPETMVKKVAEAAALRIAFPTELGGVYIQEEEDKIAENALVSAVKAEQPTIEDGIIDDRYKFPHGWKDPIGKLIGGKLLGELDLDTLKKMHETIQVKADEKAGKGVAIPKSWTEFLAATEKHIGEIENAPLDEPSEFDQFLGELKFESTASDPSGVK